MKDEQKFSLFYKSLLPPINYPPAKAQIRGALLKYVGVSCKVCPIQDIGVDSQVCGLKQLVLKGVWMPCYTSIKIPANFKPVN